MSVNIDIKKFVKFNLIEIVVVMIYTNLYDNKFVQ